MAIELPRAERILAALPDCDGCLLATPNQRQVVPPLGNRDALIAMVGEGPGRNEERYGKPFIGPAGKQLNWLLSRAGMPHRSSLWLTNAALCMPRRIDHDHLGGGIWTKTDTLRLSTQQCCKNRLHTELAQVAPRVVAAVGNYALESLTGQTSILKRHGSLIPANIAGHDTIVVPVLHPAALLRDPRNTYAVIEVFKKIHRIANSGPSNPRDIVQITPYAPEGPSAILDRFEAAVDAAIADGGDIAIDVESTTEHPRTASLTIFGFATPTTAYPVTILAWNRQSQRFEECWTPEQAARRDAIINKLVASALRKWFWNYGFDVTMCERYYPAIRGPYVDGMHYHWCIQPEMAHNLAFAMQTWQDIPPWKATFWEAQDKGEATHTDLSIYNGDDCLYTIRGKPHLEREVHLRGNAHLIDHQMKVSELARRAELYGVPACKQTTWQLKEELLQKQSVELKKMQAAILPHEAAMSRSVWEQKCRERRRKASKLGKPYTKPPFEKLTAAQFNPNSPPQARWFLFEHLELQPSRWTQGGADKDNKQLSHSYKGVLGYLSNPLVEAYVNYGEYDYKLRLIRQVEKHGEDDPNYPGWWRLFVSWNCFDAETEVLTDRGFVPFPEAVRHYEELQFAQYHPNTEKINFACGTNPIARWATDVLHIKNEQVDLAVTAGHRLLLRERPGRKRKVSVVEARHLQFNKRLVHAGECDGNSYVPPEALLRLLVACQADGSWHNGGWRFNFNRKRKQQRLFQLIEQLELPYSHAERPVSKTQKCRFSFRIHAGAVTSEIFVLLSGKRRWGRWLLELPLHARQIILEELQYWDGSTCTKDAWRYYTPEESNADLLQAVASISGLRSHKTWVDTTRGGHWKLQLCRRRMSAVTKKVVDAVYEDKEPQLVYCIDVPSTFLVVRRNGKVVVAGNCTGQKGTRWSSKIINMQNWNKAMRKLLRAVPGRAWVAADFCQIEYRIAAALAGLDELVALFNQEPFNEEDEPWKKFLGKYDAHSMVAGEVYDKTFTKPAETYAKWMPWLCQQTDKHPSVVLNDTYDGEVERVRQLCKKAKAALGPARTLIKRVVYALFYGAHPPKILQSLREDRRLSAKLRATLTEDRITEIWNGFKKRFPAWDQWAEREMHLAQKRGYQLIPPLNRRRYWTQPTVEENKIRNTPIQVAAGEVCNLVFMAAQDAIDAEKLDSQLTIHGHDAAYFDTAEKDAQRVKQIVNEKFQFWFPGVKSNVFLYGQASIGPTVADVG